MKKWAILMVTMVFISGISYANVPKSRNLDFDYEVYLKDIPNDASELKLWIPLMPNREYQIIEKVEIDPQEEGVVTEDATYKNKMLAYTLKAPLEKNYKFRINYKLKRLEFAKNLSIASSNPVQDNGDQYERFLKPNKLVTISDRIKKLAAAITEGKETNLNKAKAIYDYVYNNVEYNKEVPGWGNGDTERVCDLKAGNCTDFHSLFISLSRASGIPAKFVIGIPLKEKIQGEYTKYHCWAEFYDGQIGWIPVDISEASKDESKYEYHFGSIGENRVEVSEGRDIVLEPAQSGQPLNYFLYPHAELDGKQFKGVGVLFKYKNRDSEVAQEI